MRLSASKTFKLGPLNLTVSKTGLSASIGVPGARVGINSKGRVNYRLGKKGFSYNKSKKAF